jgi:hypothetical protein
VARVAEAATQRRERLERVLRDTDLNGASSRQEMHQRLEVALAAADVHVGPSGLDLIVRSRSAERGPAWLVRPRRLWAVLHSGGVGLRSLVRYARQAPTEAPQPRRARRSGQWRLPGGIYADRGGVIGISVALTGSAAAFLLASRRRGTVRQLLRVLAAVLVVPVAGAVGLFGLLSFLLRALRGYAEERKEYLANLMKDDTPHA